MCRVQNSSLISESHVDMPLLSDISSLLKPSLDHSAEQSRAMSRQASVESEESSDILLAEQEKVKAFNKTEDRSHQ